MNDSERPFLKVEISFDREKRYGDCYRPHLVPVEFPHIMLGVQLDSFPEMPLKEKFIATARLLYDIDYSTLINGTDFLIKEGQHTVGSGKVISVNGYDFSDNPLFAEYLSCKLSGNRKQAIRSLNRFIENLKKESGRFAPFCVRLCKILDILQFEQGEYYTNYCGHWFKEALKKLLYDFFAPLVDNSDCPFEYKKWFCLYARDFNIENNSRIDLCEQLILQCGCQDKKLVSYYVTNWISRLQYAIHELPCCYLGNEAPAKDLEVISELRKILDRCYEGDKRFSGVLSDIEQEIRGYMNTTR